MRIKNIDDGREFDWGRTSKDYALFRDIYPNSFYEKLYGFDIGRKRQKVLDLGTGTGVFPRNMYRFGADFIGVDISNEQISQARELSIKLKMDMEWLACPAEKIDFADNYFDAITAVQCWQYFDHSILVPKIVKNLKPGGKLVVAFMSWLPYENKVAEASEELVLKYNPYWNGAGMKRIELSIPEWIKDSFSVTTLHTYDERIPFTKESWNGRIRACRGIGASLTKEEINHFDREHLALLDKFKADDFNILHQIVYGIFKVKK